MTSAHPRPILATHSGKFHCDEVFAYAVLRLALGLSGPGVDHTLLRTRKPNLIETADIVWDVGSPFSSAGLVWQVYGERAVTALLPPGDSARFAASVAAALDTSLVRRIDEIDNGVSATGPIKRDTLGLATLIGEFNPTWDDSDANGPAAGDAAFLEATALVTATLRRRVDNLRARHAAEAAVLAAHQTGDDPRLLVLDTGMPWKNAVFSHDLPVLFTVSPASNGNWMIDTMPPEPGSFEQRLPLPASWAGLQAEDLAQETGVADAVFVHVRRFVGSAKSRAGAIELARKALATAEPVNN